MTKNKLSLFSVYALIFIDAIGLGVIYPILTPIFLNNSLGNFHSSTYYLQDFLYGLALTAFPLCMFLGAPILGEFSDKYGRKPVLLISLIGSALGFFISAIGIKVANLELIFIGRILDGFTAGAVPIAQAAIADLSNKENLQSRMGYIGFANATGFAVGPAIGSFFSDSSIMSWFGSAFPFIVSGLLAALNTILMFFVFSESSKIKRETTVNLLTGFENIKIAFTAKNTKMLFFAFAFFILGYFGFFNYMAVFFDQIYHASGEQIGNYITYFAVCFAISLLIILPRASKRFSSQQLLRYSMAFQPIGLLIFTVFKIHIVTWCVLIPLAIAFSFAYVAYVTLFSIMTDVAFQGRIMGVIASLTALTWAIGPVLSGLLERINVLLPMFLFIMFLFLSFLIARQATNNTTI